MSFGQSDQMREGDLNAYCLGKSNGERGKLVHDGMERWKRPTSLDRALCVAGFEDARIAKGIGSYPVLIHTGRRRFWLVAHCTYQATLHSDPPSGTAGYKSLRALFRLKNETEV